MILMRNMRPCRLTLCFGFGLLLFLFFISIPVICDAGWLTVETYEDCILKNIEKAKILEAVDAIKEACKKKFPPIFDFQQISEEAGVEDWQEIKIKPKYIILTDKEKEEAQSQYFQDNIMPYVHPDLVQEAKFQFKNYAKSFRK